MSPVLETTPNPPNPLKTRLLLVLRIVVTAAILWWIVERIDLAQVGSRLANANLLLIALAVVLLVAQWALVTVRWRWMLLRQGSGIGYGTVGLVYGVGLFFNQVLPSTIGGDVVRVVTLARQGVRLGPATRSVVCDRVFGTMALVALVALTLPVLWSVVDSAVAAAGLTAVVAGALVGFTVVLVAARQVAALPWIGRFVGTVAADLRGAALAPEALLLVVVLGIAVHLLSVLVFESVALGLGVDIAPAHALVLVPPVLLLAAVPVSIGGWGLREGGFVGAFALVGVNGTDIVAVSIAFGLVATAVGALGGLAWLLLPAARQTEARQ